MNPVKYYRIFDEEPCPCGSGMKYSLCCKKREDSFQRDNKRPVEVQAAEILKKSQYKLKGGYDMRDKKYYIALDDFERRVVVNCLNEMRNNLIAKGKYTDAVDEVLLKIIDAKQKKFKVIYKEA